VALRVVPAADYEPVAERLVTFCEGLFPTVEAEMQRRR
jgi:hypothetical protein